MTVHNNEYAAYFSKYRQDIIKTKRNTVFICELLNKNVFELKSYVNFKSNKADFLTKLLLCVQF